MRRATGLTLFPLIALVVVSLVAFGGSAAGSAKKGEHHNALRKHHTALRHHKKKKRHKKAQAPKATKSAASMLVTAATPSNAELEGSPGANWPTVGGDLSNTRYSGLTKINTGNAAKLHLVWQSSYSPIMTPAGVDGGPALEEESAPLESEGVMFLATPEDNVVAVEAATGKKLWEWEANVAEDEQKSEFVDGIQGLSLGEGKVFVETTGAQLVALNAKSGKEIWQQLVALQDTKLESPAVPSYYNGVVYVGVSGAETARGHVNAYEASDGKLIWQTFTVCGPAETPQGKCTETLGTLASNNEGGGNVWTYPALDPKNGLLFVTTSNPSADEEIAGDFKYSSSVVAMNMKTGHLEWGFQGVHHDIWDYDCTTPPVLFNNVFGGLSKEVVDFTCKTDLHYELEQKTGTPVIPVKEEPVPTSAAGKTPDVAAQEHYHASETQPIPEGTSESEVVPHCANEELLPNPAPDSSKYVYSCLFATPGTGEYIAHGINSEGGQDGKTPLAYDPKNGYMYYCETVSVAGAEVGSSKQGGSYIGVNTGWQGSVAAVNVLNNHIVWRDKLMAPGGYCRGGDTVTAGGVLFASREEGTFEAYNAETGAELWSFKGPSDLQAAPIVYEVGGKEYVAIYYGGPNALVGGMTNPRYARMLVFSVGAAAQASVKTLPKSEFSATEEEAAKLAAAK